MSDHIPNEIVIEILARLPVKPLLQFTTVSKQWYSIITNPKFILTHFNYSNTSNQHLLFRLFTNKDSKEHYFLTTNDGNFDENYSELEFPFKSLIGYFRVVGTCNGLICLCDDYFQDAQNVIIWNPCVRKSVNIELSGKPPNPFLCVIGFGFDRNEFKVVRIVYEKESLNQCKIPPVVDVYKQGENEWREIGCQTIQYSMVEFMWSQVFLNRGVHWVAYDPSVEVGFHNLIVKFDMSDEVFSEIELPQVLAEERSTCLSVTNLKESLVVLCCGQSGSGVCSVWVFEGYEAWRNLYNIVLPGVMTRALGFRKNGEILFAAETGKVMSYDSGNQVISTTSLEGSSYSLKVLNFSESLFLLKEGNDVSDWVQNVF